MSSYIRFCNKLLGYCIILLVFSEISVSAYAEDMDIPSNYWAEATLAHQLIDQSGVRGGLVVHLGSDNGRLTAVLRVGENYTVQGLERDSLKVGLSRRHIHSLGLYGPVSIDYWNGRYLPYANNLVNLIIAEDEGNISIDEMLRVLAPHGVALVKRDGKWAKTVKPWPDDIDEWTHYLHGPGNNAVADDAVVGPPRHLQWVNPPLWSRSHEHLANLSAMVSAGGRLFYIIDKGITADVSLPPEWVLVARDAFNGIALWEKSVEQWMWRLRPFRTGPADLARRLVAVKDRVYVTLSYGGPVVALEGATGQTMHIYDHTKNTQEIVYSDNVLYLVIGDETIDAEAQADSAALTEIISAGLPVYLEPKPRTNLLAVNANNGDILWQKSGEEVENIMPATLAVSEGRVFFQNSSYVVCMDAKDGRKIWRAERNLSHDRPEWSAQTRIIDAMRNVISRDRPAWSSPTLVVYDGVVLSADRKGPEDAVDEDGSPLQWSIGRAGSAPAGMEGELIAFSADNGQRLWSAPCREGWHSPIDVFVAGGLVWTGNLVGARDPGIVQGLDLLSGDIIRTRPHDQEFYEAIMSHARCYRHKATNRYILTGRSGVEFVDIQSGEATPHHWVRGECQYGILPANGLLYSPPHPCACFILAKLNSFHALASGQECLEKVESRADRLEKGSAYNKVEPHRNISGDWPTYRHNAARSGSTTVAVPFYLAQAWETKLQAPLTAPVAAGGRVYVASIDMHTIHALKAGTGQQLWQFTAGGRVDSPPTIWNGRVFFGSADGWVYCLRAEDGALVWRYHVAPTDRMVIANGQLESAWPVHGSVVVLPVPDSSQTVAYASAGRSSYLDGGIVMARLDALKGIELSRTVVDSRDSNTGYQPHPLPRPTPGFSMPGALNDVLSVQHNSLFMRHRRFTLDGDLQDDTVPHLHSPAGFLDDSWWHRTYWIAGEKMHSGYGSWLNMGNLVPSGRLLVMDDTITYGYGRDRYDRDGSHVGLGGASYRLFARSRTANPLREAEENVFLWEKRLEIYVRAMVLADKTLFVAGPVDPLIAEDPVAVWEGRAGGLLWAVSADTGEKLAAYPLDAPPVFDSMIAKPGRLFFTTTDGRVMCFTAQKDANQTQ